MCGQFLRIEPSVFLTAVTLRLTGWYGVTITSPTRAGGAVKVQDVKSGAKRRYTRKSGAAPPITDPKAFACAVGRTASPRHRK